MIRYLDFIAATALGLAGAAIAALLLWNSVLDALKFGPVEAGRRINHSDLLALITAGLFTYCAIRLIALSPWSLP